MDIEKEGVVVGGDIESDHMSSDSPVISQMPKESVAQTPAEPKFTTLED